MDLNGSIAHLLNHLLTRRLASDVWTEEMKSASLADMDRGTVECADLEDDYEDEYEDDVVQVN